MDLEKDVLRVADIMGRLAPRAQRYVEHVIERDGMNVGMSVATNTATNLIVFVLLTVDMHGADPREFLRLMTEEIERKLAMARAELKRPEDAPVH